MRRLSPLLLSAIGILLMASSGVHAVADIIGSVNGYVIATVRQQYPSVSPEDITVKIQEGYSVPVLRGGATAQVVPPTTTGKLVGYVRIPVRVLSASGQVILTEEVPVFVAVRRPALMTIRQLRAGMIVSAADVRVSKIEAASAPATAFSIPKQVIGLQVVSDLAADTILIPWMLRVIPVIAKGQPVTLMIKNGNVEVELKAIALQDGALGEKIRVRTVLSQKELTGEVLDEKKVKIQSGR